MKKIVIISGSPRPKGNTYKITQVFERVLNELGEYNFEYMSLKKVQLDYCKGCLLCMKKGNNFCPCKDQMTEIRDKMLEADGVIFTSPVYVHTVSAMMKNFIDRFAWSCHQPHFLGKSALLLVTTELSGMKESLDYMKFPVNAGGFKIAGSCGVVYPSYQSNPDYQQKAEQKLIEAAQAFHDSLIEPAIDTSFKKLIFFHLLKLKVQLHKEELPYDYEYWKAKGWLDMPFYTFENLPAIKNSLAKRLVKIRSKSILKKAGITNHS